MPYDRLIDLSNQLKEAAEGPEGPDTVATCYALTLEIEELLTTRPADHVEEVV